MNTKRIIIVITLIVTGYLSCSTQESEWQGAIEEVDGVTVVKNPVEPMYGPAIFKLEEEVSIGEAEGREEYMFVEVQSITTDDEGRIYVLDSEEYNVKIYDRDGTFVHKFGREGQGPGEFSRPIKVVVTNQDEILVQNLFSKPFNFFSLEGKYKRSVSPDEFMLGGSDFDTNGNIIAPAVVRDFETRVELRKYDPDMNHLFSYGSSPTPNTARDGYNPFSPSFRWTLINGDQVVFGLQEEYNLSIFDSGGRLVKRILKEYKRIKITKEDVDEEVGGEGLSPGALELQKKLLETLKLPEYHLPFRRLIADDEARIFVLTYERVENGKGYYWDVFDAEGKCIAKIPLKTRPFVLTGGKLYTVEEDDDGYQYIKRYKITWNY
jgi:hypothetical protein